MNPVYGCGEGRHGSIDLDEAPYRELIGWMAGEQTL